MRQQITCRRSSYFHSSSNRRLQIEVGILREMLQKSELEEFRWISTELQVANALTKAGDSVILLEINQKINSLVT